MTAMAALRLRKFDSRRENTTKRGQQKNQAHGEGGRTDFGHIGERKSKTPLFMGGKEGGAERNRPTVLGEGGRRVSLRNGDQAGKDNTCNRYLKHKQVRVASEPFVKTKKGWVRQGKRDLKRKGTCEKGDTRNYSAKKAQR